VPEAQLLSVSSKGELAIILGARHVDQRLYKGTLARMTLGSTPRPVLDGAREADWSPDGASLAVIRDLGNGRDRLEYPIGTTVYEMTGYLSDLRVSPDGEHIAFFDHPRRYDDRGWVKMVDRAGTVTTLAGEFAGLEGLSWTDDGSTVVFGGNAANGYFMQPMAVRASSDQTATTVLAVPGRFIPYDHTSDGRWLAVREDLSFGVRARVPGADHERELSWLGSVGVRSMSEDGQWLLMVDNAANANYGVVLRKTDGSQTLRLGEGNPQQLSPDGKWSAAIISLPQQTLVVYPTGAGEPIRITSRIERYETVEWFPDSKRLFVCGAEATRAPRCYQQALDGSLDRSTLEPITAEGVKATLAPDGQTLLLAHPDGSFARSSIGGGAETPVAALQPDDRIISWSRDSQSVFVQRDLGAPARVERVALATGQRSVAGEVTPEGVAAVTQINVKAWAEDGRWYAYNYTTLPSTLFVVAPAAD
jgi:Tol biopolymer transport system component